MPDREILETDVLIVGAGAAGLACAISLHDQIAQHNNLHPEHLIAKPTIYVIEKGVSVGAHILSGAVMDPRALDELIPDWKHQGAPHHEKVTAEEILFLTQKKAVPVLGPLIPPYLHNKGNYIISLGELTIWLAEQAKKRGVEILEGVPGAELIIEGQKVLGVRCADSGVGKDGKPRPTFQ